MWKKQKITGKFCWYLLLLIAIIFFLQALATGNYLYNVLTMIVAFLINRYGYSSLFKDFDQQRKTRRDQIIREREEKNE